MNDLLLCAPILVAAGTGILVMALDLLSGRDDPRKGFLGVVTAAGLAIAAVLAVTLWPGAPAFEMSFLKGVLIVDGFVAFFSALVLATGAAAALLAVDHLPEQGIEPGAFQTLLAFSATGALAFVAAADLVTMFLGLEVMSLAVYALAASKRSSGFATEAGLKYFVLGGLASAFLLFGVAFLYGATGSLDLAGIAAGLAGGASSAGADRVLPQVALVLLLVAMGFKVAAVPFHFWTPDVYEGAPTPVTAYMAGAVKAAGFAVLSRLILTVYQAPSWGGLPLSPADALLGLAVLTMVVGNVLGVVQDDVKRILAYSSIAHAGYLLLGVWATDPATRALNDGVPFYLLAYVAATVGAFGVVSLLGARGEEDMRLPRLAGLSKRHPVLAAVLLVCVLSLAGIPPFGGFMGKFNLFKAVLAADPASNVTWVVVAVLNSLVALYYYLRILLYAYFREPEVVSGDDVAAAGHAPAIRSAPAWAAIGVAALASLYLGILPGRMMAASGSAASAAVVRPDLSAALAAPAALAPGKSSPAPAPASPTVSRRAAVRDAGRDAARDATRNDRDAARNDRDAAHSRSAAPGTRPPRPPRPSRFAAPPAGGGSGR
ncbi:MAG: NADH-quinone oxidoreductase subunit N [Deltaproteobacteria bacterium]|nr:NADH-quinone oxidoreductase subunit N [Deltaproteobacteria bacterium]